MSGVHWPAPTGAHPVGVHDLELVDTSYPHDDPGGRRLMARAWYPAGEQGAGRPYFLGPEQQACAQAMTVTTGRDGAALDAFAAVQTCATVDAKPVDAEASLPLVVFSHGGASHVAQSAALMEDLASHGYVVISVAHPGGSGHVLYGDGTLVPLARAFVGALAALATDPDFLAQASFDLQRREALVRRLVAESPLAKLAPRWRDDLIAAVDHLSASREADSLVGRLARASDLGRVAYVGMSLGGCAAVSAAQDDPRAVAAVNLDGAHWLDDVLDADARVATLALAHDSSASPLGAGWYYNSFFYEPLTTLGERADVSRFEVAGATHLDFSDLTLLPDEARASLGMRGIDGRRMTDLTRAVVSAFLDGHLRDAETRFPDALVDRFPELRAIDLTDVRTWATTGRLTSTTGGGA